MSGPRAKLVCRVDTDEDRHAIAELLESVKDTPVRVTVAPFHERITETKNRALNAHLRDIARWRLGDMLVPDRVFDRVVEDFKATDIWPHYDDPEPDYYTGEVLYRPKSRADLTDFEARNIVRWLEAYMQEHEIPSHAPVDRWTA